MAEHLRETVRELLLTTQPPALVNKTEADVRELARGYFDTFLTNMREWCQADRPRRAEESAAAAIQRLPATPVDETAPQAAETPKGKRGRVADPEMEALRLQRLTLECAVLERANHVARGDLLPLQEALNAFQEHIGRFRHDLRNCLLNEQPATMTGRSEADIRQLNQKTFHAFNRRLRTSLDALDAFMLPTAATA